MACSIKAKPGLDLLMGHKPVTLLIQQGGHVGGQEYNFFPQQFTSEWCSLPGGEKCFVLDPARTWPP